MLFFLVLNLYDVKDSGCTKYGHFSHTTLAVRIAVPTDLLYRVQGAAIQKYAGLKGVWL